MHNNTQLYTHAATQHTHSHMHTVIHPSDRHMAHMHSHISHTYTYAHHTLPPCILFKSSPPHRSLPIPVSPSWVLEVTWPLASGWPCSTPCCPHSSLHLLPQPRGLPRALPEAPSSPWPPANQWPQEGPLSLPSRGPHLPADSRLGAQCAGFQGESNDNLGEERKRRAVKSPDKAPCKAPEGSRGPESRKRKGVR